MKKETYLRPEVDVVSLVHECDILDLSNQANQITYAYQNGGEEDDEY